MCHRSLLSEKDIASYLIPFRIPMHHNARAKWM